MRKQDEGNTRLDGLLRSGLLGMAVTMLMLLLLLGLVSALIEGETLSLDLGDELLILCVLLSATVGALTAAKRQGSGKLPAALLSGGLCFGLLLLLTALGGRGSRFTAMTLKEGLSCLCGGAVGGVLGSTKRKKRKTRKIR